MLGAATDFDGLVVPWVWLFADNTENTLEGVGGVFVGSDRDGIDAHLDNWVIIATRLSHVAEVQDVFLVDVEFFEEVRHAEGLIHARSDGVNRGGATDFVVKFWAELTATDNNGLAFLVIWVPGVFFFGAGFLAERREGDLRKAVLNDFVAGLELVRFPVAEFTGGLLDGGGDFGNLFIGERIVVNLSPILAVVAIVLGSLRYEEM